MTTPNAAPLPPLAGAKLVLASIALALATFMNVLDITIANVSIPSIAGDIGVSASQGTWVITSFAVANAIAVPLTGWLTQRYGQVRLFVAAVLLFVVASLLCGLATNLGTLILFRILQGAAAGPMIPLSQALLLQSYPKQKSGTALSMWAMTTMIAPVLGPILGGWISDNISWPWIFYINIPTGLFAAWLTWLLLRDRESPRVKKPIDRMGLALLVIWVGCLQVMLDKGRELDWFSSALIVALAVIAFVAFVLFVIWETTQSHPVVDLSLFARRNFAIGTTAISLGYGVFFANLVLLPLWLQQFAGYTATWAGIVSAPVGLLALLLSPTVGKNVGRVDVRWLASLSFFVFAVVCLMRSRFNMQADIWTIMAPQFVQGAAMATFFVPLTALALSGLPQSRLPAASGLYNFVRITAGAFGASAVGTLWESRADVHHVRLAEMVTPDSTMTRAALDNLAHLGYSLAQSYQFLEHQINTQAYMLAANELFWGSAVLFLLLIGVVWLARPVRPQGSVDAGGAH
ncbi:DHA2 family efflux MFS transporter permease subunit [Burkholderia lata]|uniref:EmrB/QacA family protein drug resistance transporter n=1 Tax=Burkholderia lata (strain ATCC 17760 / DSM 23089 / LMG 22485 / NCIMB 9086 / R18194 / 383) TaxID=482957 RepID=A0A6P2U1T2_BURL3|nr:DHA2 family efflux MFS transporter permease subunit [Burkholderia lata]VWC63384.1 EmrB/QacA family protein drug resistance transporter [Burkholderia lata]